MTLRNVVLALTLTTSCGEESSLEDDDETMDTMSTSDLWTEEPEGKKINPVCCRFKSDMTCECWSDHLGSCSACSIWSA